jgi:transmembrane sensor
MTLPKFPLRDRLNDPASAPALARIWEGIDARYPRRRHRRAPTVVVLSTVAALGVVAGFWLHPHPDAGPLRMADGQPLATVEAPAAGAVMALSDGSRITLSGGARLQPLESSGTGFVATLTSGSAEFYVKPGGPRRWRVACGLATVEVVGTQFSCAREPGRLEVAVQHGTVLVAGERVPDRMQSLDAGQNLIITDGADDEVAPTPAEQAPVAPAAGEPAAPDSEVVAPRPAGKRAAAEPSWRDLARHGRHQEAFAALGTAGLRRETGRLGVADLFALADVARLSGHPAEAEAPLARIVNELSHDPQAPLAAFALGRLDLDVLDHPRQAAAAFSRALSLGIPVGLREDVRGRLVEAYARAGELTSAREAADAYAREFPDGRYAKAIAAQLSRVKSSPRP